MANTQLSAADSAAKQAARAQFGTTPRYREMIELVEKKGMSWTQVLASMQANPPAPGETVAQAAAVVPITAMTPEAYMAANPDYQTDIGKMSVLASLYRSQNEALRKLASTQTARGTLSLKVSEKGALAVYGLGRFPVTLYKEQWLRLLDEAVITGLRKFIADNAALLKSKPATATVKAA